MSPHSDRAKTALKMAALCGLALALGMDLLWFFAFYPAMPKGNPWGLPLILLTCLIQTMLTTAGAVGFVWAYLALKVSRWWPLIYGAVMGACIGGISLGVSIGVRGVIGTARGIIISLGESAHLNALPWWRIFGEGFVGGFAFGTTALIPGVIGALIRFCV